MACFRWRGALRRNWLLVSVTVTALFVHVLSPQEVRAQEEALAAAGPPVSIALLVDSDIGRCYDRGYVAAVERLVRLQQDKINARGGVNGREVEISILDGRRDTEQTIENVRTALALPDLLAMIGLSSAFRGEKVFAALGDEIRNSGVPFISHISVSDVFAGYPNVFSTRPSQEAERVPVMAAFIEEMGFRSIAFLGRAGPTYIRAIGDSLKESAIADRLTADHRIRRAARRGAQLDGQALENAISDMKAKQADLVVLAVGTVTSDDVIKAFAEAAFTPALMLVGNLTRVADELSGDYPNAIYQLDWGAVPEVDQDSVRNVVARSNPEEWLFEGAKLADAPGWQEGTCDPDYEPEPFSPTNLRAIAFGAQFADMVSLVTEAARDAGRRTELTEMRKAVVRALGETFAAGKGAFHGRFENWSFFPDTRTRAQTPFVIILPHTLGRTQLAPIQFVRTRQGTLRRIDTLYVDVDMLRTYAINNNERSFYADFYLSIRASERIGLDDIKFMNAFIDPRTNGPHLTIETIYGGGPTDAYPESMRFYRISGRFRFNPDFANYPFDSQRFSIDIQPRSGDKQFIIQPPPLALRDPAVSVENWDLASQYVSYAHAFVPVVDAFTHEPSIVPFYETRFVWQMTRETTDYYLRVLVPLMFILIVAYLSIFIPQSHLEAIITLQVTALLAAVALYLSLPQIDSDTATVSDRIFVLDYMMVSLMIFISILRINVRSHKWRLINNALVITHAVLIPVLVVVSAALILQALPVETVKELASWEYWRALIGIA
ncbi:ABC transporter substrate-binding protein [Dichotomicrobium thermohalophilum]|uniref:ABC-type branched-subunit amino acid transport system substrate-binding protein n=1 Tax=Dichotomicrobium thermohalophilum TaxID=933063 RepID=A0A397Q3L3_9HYPH|nr:ABC transporter substrate-binding protein [Dichotomicrobium thermohalophilum]RIA55712.1 ABC-type branched-subunit amino acid transport system substrate-binding protein [Dichotomicrobium thermohalophilum]